MCYNHLTFLLSDPLVQLLYSLSTLNFKDRTKHIILLLCRTVPLNYNLIFTCVNMSGNMTQLREISSFVCINLVSHSVEYTCLTLCHQWSFHVTMHNYSSPHMYTCVDLSNHAWWLTLYFMCVYLVAITQWVCLFLRSTGTTITH